MVAKSGHAISALTEAALTEAIVPAPMGPAVVSDTSLKAPEAITPRDPKLAAYIAHMSVEMATMARAAGFDLLAYFLDMARIEANIQSGKDA